MSTSVPSPSEVRAALERLGYSGMADLSKLSGVPSTTLDKIRRGETKDPGIATVNLFWPHVHKLKPQTV